VCSVAYTVLRKGRIGNAVYESHNVLAPCMPFKLLARDSSILVITVSQSIKVCLPVYRYLLAIKVNLAIADD
jgi:hypothetical protein